MLESGIWPGIEEDIYRAFNAVSYSDLKAWVNGEFKPTPAMNIGSALHALILEPEKAGEKFWTAPEDVDRRSKEGREQYEAWCDDHRDKAVLLPKEREEVKRLVKSVRENPTAMKIIEAPGDNEVSIVSTLPGRTLLSKCRVDMVRAGSLWDIKTTGLNNAQEFEEAIATYAYDAQAAYYADQHLQATKNWKPFGWICVSKRSLTCWVTLANPQHMASGRRWYNDICTLKERFDA